MNEPLSESERHRFYEYVLHLRNTYRVKDWMALLEKELGPQWVRQAVQMFEDSR